MYDTPPITIMGHARIRFFAQQDFDTEKMKALGLGPILFKEECHFIRELKLNDLITINILKGAINEDASRWSMHHEIYNQNGIKCAHITIKGAWMDLNARKLTVPPKEIAKAMHLLDEGEDYVYGK